MPLSKEETLALSNALVRAARKYIPYSTNIRKVWKDFISTFLYEQMNSLKKDLREPPFYISSRLLRLARETKRTMETRKAEAKELEQAYYEAHS